MMKLATGTASPRNNNFSINATINHQTTSHKAGSLRIEATSPKAGSLKIETASSWGSSCKSFGTCSGMAAARAAAELRHKWMELQGIKNWDGLLDPLDDGLRDEILRYGEFVDAAYRSFNFDTSSPDYATCLYPDRRMLLHCGNGNTGYEVTKHLHATCGVRLPNWTDRINPSWPCTRSSWIGYVAVCTDEKEIQRLGRRDVVIAYRGTATCMEWLENLRATLAPLPADMAPDDNSQSMVQTGFLSLYTSRPSTCPSLRDSIRSEVSRILKTYAGEALSITVTGHSLGAALATLTAHDITTSFQQTPLVTVVSFGGPRVGNGSFRSELERSGAKVLRIVNSDDPITKVPGIVLEEGAGLSNWLRRRVEETQWVYAEVGRELRLSSRDCPDLRADSVATCHDLKTYLHLVDNFVSSNCPLKRVLNAANV